MDTRVSVDDVNIISISSYLNRADGKREK